MEISVITINKFLLYSTLKSILFVSLQSSTPTSVKKARLSNNVIQISKGEYQMAILHFENLFGLNDDWLFSDPEQNDLI